MEESQTLVLTLVRRSCERLSKSTQACGGTSMCTNKLGIQIHLYFATFVLVPVSGLPFGAPCGIQHLFHESAGPRTTEQRDGSRP